MSKPKSFRELADLLVTEAVNYGILDRRRCRLDVIANDMYNTMLTTDWYMYIMSREPRIGPESFCWWLNADGDNSHDINDMWDYASEVEDRVLGNLNVIDGDAVRWDRWNNLIEVAHLHEYLSDFIFANTALIQKL